MCCEYQNPEYDTHDPKGHNSPVLPFLMKRAKVIEIVAARDIVFALAHSGVCAAFSRGTPHLPLIPSTLILCIAISINWVFIYSAKP